MPYSNTRRDLEQSGHVSFLNGRSERRPASTENPLSSVFEAFDLQPKKVERFSNKVWRITDDQDHYALKKVQLTPDQRSRLIVFHQKAHSLPIQTAPLFLTKKGQPYHQEGGETFLLSRWLSTPTRELPEHPDMLWDSLADWHRLTTQTIEVEPSWKEAFSERCKEVWSEQVLTLDLFMNDCEHRLYPSPFEQRFMAIYQQLRSGAEVAYRHLQGWSEHVSDKKELRMVLCQGKPSPDHLIVSGSQRNWISTEQSGMDFSVRDLTWLLRWGNLDDHPDALQRGFDIYELIYPLEQHEKLLLSGQLCQPARVVRLLHDYHNRREALNEAELTLALETAYHHWGRTWQAFEPLLKEKEETPETETKKESGKEANKKEAKKNK